jgi:hypothetical protein
MGPGSVATAGTASGRPSHHHAAATAAAVRMNKPPSFRMKIPNSLMPRAATHAQTFQLSLRYMTGQNPQHRPLTVSKNLEP